MIILPGKDSAVGDAFINENVQRYSDPYIASNVFQLALGIVSHGIVRTWHSYNLRSVRTKVKEIGLIKASIRKTKLRNGSLNENMLYKKKSFRRINVGGEKAWSYTLSRHLHEVDKNMWPFICSMAVYGVSLAILSYVPEYHRHQKILKNVNATLYNTSNAASPIYHTDLIYMINMAEGKWKDGGYQCLCERV